MASEKETIPKEDKAENDDAKDTNGDKNKNGESADAAGAEKQKLSLGEIAAIDSEIAKAKTEQLQVLHNLFYGKNGSGPQIKRNIRKFAGFSEGEKQKKLDLLLTFELAAIKLTATVLALQDIKKDETKENVSKTIVDFLMAPTGKTFEEVQMDEPEEEPEEEASVEEEEEEEEEVKPKGKKGRGGANSAGRPKRATASRVWTNDYGSSEEEEIEEARPRVGRKKRGDNSDSGSDYNPSGGSDSEADRRKSSRNTAPARPTRGGRGRRARDSESEEESEESEDFSEDEVVPAKKKKTAPPNRSAPKRGATQRGRKRKQETESEEEVSEEEEEADSEDSEKQKKPARKTVTPKSTPQKKNSKGRPKRAAPPASKKKRKDATSDEEEPEEEIESEDDEPLKKPHVKKGVVEGPTDDDIKKLLKDILAEANLEEITMKTVCKKVYAHYPNHDLSQRKDFIKQTVKSLIAA